MGAGYPARQAVTMRLSVPILMPSHDRYIHRKMSISCLPKRNTFRMMSEWSEK